MLKLPAKLFLVLISVILVNCKSAKENSNAKKYLFFLHNRFVEIAGVDGYHPEYGKCEYLAIISAFKNAGFTVISEVRPGNSDGDEYAKKVAGQVDSLLKTGVSPGDITVVGTSKGGYIAQRASTIIKNKEVNYVFIGCCLPNEPMSGITGNVLSIYEKGDSLGRSCMQMKMSPANNVGKFTELMLNTGIQHGYLYKGLDAWIQPAIQWANGQYEAMSAKQNIFYSIDSLINTDEKTPFNGIITINQNGRTIYAKGNGFSDMVAKKPILYNNQFVIGSVSKQFTAMLVLREFDKGHLKLTDPIKKYLPQVKRTWADTVTIHHLLTHTHGIPELDPANFSFDSLSRHLQFIPGSAYNYSQTGFLLMEKIVEKASGKPFPTLAAELFAQCGMKYTFYPVKDSANTWVQGYTEDSLGIQPDLRGPGYNHIAAGGFVSTATDLLLWNDCLHNNKLLKEQTYKMATTAQPNATRQHRIFGTTQYGYGITVQDKPIARLGQTGFSPGFVSMNFYYPATNTSVVVLSNIAYGNDDIKKAFYYHSEILEIIENSDLVR